MLGAQGKLATRFQIQGILPLDEGEEDGEAAQLHHNHPFILLWPLSFPFLCQPVQLWAWDPLDPSPIRPSCLGPSFQVLNLLEFVLHCSHFILMQGKVLILAVFVASCGFFPCKHPSSA